MNAHRGTTYQDAFAVVSGLDRLQGDLEDVANEGESWRHSSQCAAQERPHRLHAAPVQNPPAPVDGAVRRNLADQQDYYLLVRLTVLDYMKVNATQ